MKKTLGEASDILAWLPVAAYDCYFNFQAEEELATIKEKHMQVLTGVFSVYNQFSFKILMFFKVKNNLQNLTRDTAIIQQIQQYPMHSPFMLLSCAIWISQVLLDNKKSVEHLHELVDIAEKEKLELQSQLEEEQRYSRTDHVQ